MRPSTPRLPPLAEEQWSAEQRELMAPFAREGRIHNIFTTLVRHPKLLKRWLPFANHILFKSSLAPREREMVILRTAWLCRAEYEWGQHVVIGKKAGLSEAEIARIAEGPDATGWSAFDAAILSAVDELRDDACLSDASWAALAQRYDTAQLMDLLFTAGNYAMLAMALNSLGVRLDPGLAGFSR
jgi:4-carboxymuconolactone decarboxylase